MSAADDLRALAAATTPGPWNQWGVRVRGSYVHIWTADERIVARSVLSPDAEFIVWCRNHADALTDLIEWANDAPHHDGCNARHNGSPQPAAARPYPCKCGRYAALAALEADRG